MKETQKKLIYQLAKSLDMIIEYNGIRYRFIDGKLFKLK